MVNYKYVENILNRKPNRWGNLTNKEFERDIQLLQEEVLRLREQLKGEIEKKDQYLQILINSIWDDLELLNKYGSTESKISFKEELENIYKSL